MAVRRIDTGLSFGYIRKMTGVLLRFLLYAAVAYTIYLLLRFLLSPRRPIRSGRPPARLSGIMVKDEICNTYLPKDEAVLERADGDDHYFCSQECRQKFLERQKSGG